MKFVHTAETADPTAAEELESAAHTFRFVPNFSDAPAKRSTATTSRAVAIMSRAVPYPVRCSEIWGGNGNADLDVCASGINASVYSQACGGDRGGDVYYLSVCAHDMITRMIVADVRGHGEQVSQLSAWLHEEIQAHLGTLDSGSLLGSLNGKLFRRGFEALTTAAVLTYYAGDSRLYVSSAGHPPALLRKRDGPWTPVDLSSGHTPSNLPLGVRDSTVFGRVAVSVGKAGDRVAIYTNGISECTDGHGEEFGQDRVCAVLENCGAVDLDAAKRCLLDATRQA